MAFGKCKVYCSPVRGEKMPASLSLCHLLPFLCDPGKQISSDSPSLGAGVALDLSGGSPLGIQDRSAREGE